MRIGNWTSLAGIAALLAAGGCAGLPFPKGGAKTTSIAAIPDEPSPRAQSAVRSQRAKNAEAPAATESVSNSKPAKAAAKNSPKDKYASQMSLARLSERHGQSDSAAELYEAILRKEPKNYAAHHRLGVIAGRKGDFSKAEEHFEQAQALGADSAEFWSDRGYCQFLQDNLDGAEKNLRLAIQRDPRHKAARNNLGLVLGERGNFDESLAQFRNAVGEAEAHVNLGYVKAQASDFEGAEQHYHQALRMNGELKPAAEALVQLPQNRQLAASGVARKHNSNDIWKKQIAAKEPAQDATAPVAKKAGDLVVAVPPTNPAEKPTRKPSEVLRMSDDDEETPVVDAGSTASATMPVNPVRSRESVQAVSYESPPRPTAAEVAQKAFRDQGSTKARPAPLKNDASQDVKPINNLRAATTVELQPVEGYPWQRPSWLPPQQ